MTREELIKLGLSDEQVASVMSLHGQTVTTLKDQISTLEASENDLKAQTAKHEADLKKLQKDNADNEDLKNTIKDLQAQNTQAKADYEAKLLGVQRDTALEKALSDSGAKNAKAVKALLDADKIIFKDGELSGVTEQLDGFKESDPYLFEMGQRQGSYTPNGGAPAKTYASMEEAIQANDVETFIRNQYESEEK